MDFLWFIILGAVAGWLAGQIMKGGGFGLIWNIIVGNSWRSNWWLGIWHTWNNGRRFSDQAPSHSSNWSSGIIYCGFI